MTALLYVIVAVGALVLAIDAFVDDRQEPARQAYLALGVACAVAYIAFALSLLPALYGFRALSLMSACFIPPALLWTIERAFPKESRDDQRGLNIVYAGAFVAGPLSFVLHFAVDSPTSRVAGIVTGIYATYGFGVALQRLWNAREAAHLRIRPNRMQYLFLIVAAALAFAWFEGAARMLAPPAPPEHWSMSRRVVALQGPVPPFSTVFSGLALYFLYHSVVLSRLLNLAEVMSRITAVLLSAIVLVMIDGLTFLWVDTFAVFPFHSTLQLLLASVMFLAAYDPLRKRVTWLTNRAFDRRSHELFDALDVLRRQLPSIINRDTLVGALLDALHGSGRVSTCSVYLWDTHLDAFVCAGSRGHGEHPPLQRVASKPFTLRFAKGAPFYHRVIVERRAALDPDQQSVVSLMDAMNADVTFPLASGATILGWIHLRDAAWSDGYEIDEIHRLGDIARRASTSLTNIQGFQAIEEQRRLAALGEMSAGLAHEIRNPLAGIKGAAQFLQAESFSNEAMEMLRIIVDETDRLNVVVSQFLDYARPVSTRIEPMQPNGIVEQALRILRAEGLPDNVTLQTHLTATPLVRIDPDRMTQVLLNLLRNALQALHATGGTIHIRTALEQRTGHAPAVAIRIQDDGVGFSEQELEQLFVPFYTTKKQGTGLGLAISRRIVHAHDGEIDVYSAQGHGAEFVIRLPITESEANA